jgi:uncharacterized protein YeaO (DUF488 family)
MPYVFGDIATCYWNGLDDLRGRTSKELYVVKVCNTAKGRIWDSDWYQVYPDWDDIDSYRTGLMTWTEFRERYMLKLEKNANLIIHTFQEIEALAYKQGKMIVLTCHEKPGEYCHRNILINWLLSKKQVRYILNCDVIMCQDCYLENAEESGDAWTEHESNLVVGKTTFGPCESCGQ